MDLHLNFASIDDAKAQGELAAAKIVLAMLLSERQDQRALFERCITFSDGFIGHSEMGDLMNQFATSYQTSLGEIFALAKIASDRRAEG